MKTKLIIVIVFLMGITTHNAQILGDFNPKEQRFGYGPRKFPTKNVYIANFSVNYQVFNYQTSSSKGGGFFKGVVGKTKAELAVGLDIPVNTIQQITDNAYKQFVNELKAKGFTIVNDDVVKSIDYYKDYERHEGLEMSASEAAGFLTAYPSDAVFYVKGFHKSGKKKDGVGIGSFQWRSEVERFNTISSQLNDATIIDVNLYVLFMKNKKTSKRKANLFNRSSINAKTNLMLAANEGVASRVATNADKSKWTNKLGLTAPGTKEVISSCFSKIHFIAGKNKIGGSPFGTYVGVLKKNLEIEGVIAEGKITSEAVADYDTWGTETAFGRLYSAQNKSVKNSAIIKTDANKYEKGVQLAIDTFLKHHVNEFKSKFFK